MVGRRRHSVECLRLSRRDTDSYADGHANCDANAESHADRSSDTAAKPDPDADRPPDTAATPHAFAALGGHRA
jgi:hypothetical protein